MYQAAYDRSGTQMTEDAILEEIFADQLGLKAAGATFRGEVYVDGDLAYNEFGERTVEEFTNEFLKVLTSNKTLDLAGKKFNLDSTIASMFEVATMFGGNSSPLISNLDSKGLSALKNFFIEKVSPTDVYNGLAGTGHIVRVSPTHIALYDNSGNRMDKNGKPTNKPLIYPMELANKASTHLRKVRNKNKNIQTIEGYLNKMKNVASAQFSKTVEPLSVYSKIVENSENSYGDQFSTEKKGITKTIQDEFSKEFETEKFMRQMVANKFKQKYKDSHAATENPLEDEKAAIEATLAYVEEEGADFLKEMADVKTIFEFKTTEGTYLHNIAELFTRAINYSQKIDYGEHVKNRSHTYFMKHILDAILGITADGKTSDNPKDAFVAYFEKFFFNHLTDDGSLEYAEFKASFDWAVDQMGFSTKDTAAKTRLLTNLDKVLKDEIFDELPGPITLMPEVKLGSSTLGVRGIIDLLVIDGKGVAHIFDYKSKEVNKEGQWDYVGKPDRVKLKGAMDSYDDNAMMKASIQTSVYRLMLAEL
ncbi:MAG: PD-(D/E)XK nuclease family protein, partial [Chlamydiia bacterium]|nr:PD-(D/E)XK nuclease family protein [Chlamydiia bacterium]